jgi:isoleucyl-tRNA synthetase
VVTNGFVIDLEGQKMSKSRGDAIEPAEVIKQSGADILRLWVAMSDYREDIRVSKEILARAVEAYRKIRNTLRYLIANLYDFNPPADRVPHGQLEEVDRYILAKYAEVGQRILHGYDEYDYAPIFQALNAFTTVDLSAFYNDISKDRLYTFAAGSRERRSAQTAMYTIADGLTRLMAPILSFTADELWRFLPASREESVHMAVFPTSEDLLLLMDAELTSRWEQLVRVRERVVAEIEPLRKDKKIGSSLQAKVTIAAPPAELALLERYARALPMLFIVSEVAVTAAAGPEMAITIDRASGVKCERCWRYVPSVSTEPAWKGLCERCQDALAEPAHQGQRNG